MIEKKQLQKQCGIQVVSIVTNEIIPNLIPQFHVSSI